jgi:hypothetical protein
MKNLSSENYYFVQGGTCYSFPALLVVEHFTGVCIGITVR